MYHKTQMKFQIFKIKKKQRKHTNQSEYAIYVEQKDTKTSNVTEELILYLFLGVFVIFTVDSFTKVGKYTR